MSAPDALAEIRQAMQGYDWRLEAVLTFSHGVAVQVYAKAPHSKRHSKVGPLLFPPDGGTFADTLRMLGELGVGEAEVAK
jgi:hypothetical protein